ncbi:MAG: FAD:protein transferase [Campylobacterota bacterium]|nr:FAD:protein transferase [Campylobacterota bacterium]
MFDFLFEKALKASVMSTELFIKAKASKNTLLEAFKIAKDIEEKFSAYKNNSAIDEINKNAGIAPVACDDEVLALIKESLKIAKATDGKFDPTIGTLSQGLYGFGTKNPKIPSQKEISLAKELVNFKEVEILGNLVFLRKKGMKIDLGGIGKGYAAEKIINFFIDKKASFALASVGGEICCYGKEYKIGIKNPFEEGNIATITTTKNPTTITTSGDYERYINSKKTHHILDSKNGISNNFYSSITLIKDGFFGSELDAFATAIFNTKPQELEKISKEQEMTIIAITPNKEILFLNKEKNFYKKIDFEQI